MHIKSLNEWSGLYKEFIYHIDLDERGMFNAHVDDPDGDVVFEFNNYDSEDGEIWLVEAGYMKHTKDVEGLQDYLVTMGVMNPGDVLRLG